MNHSPMPVKIHPINQSEMDFGDAMLKAKDGHKVRSKAWPTDHYAYFRADVLHIHRSTEGLDGTEHRMLLGTGDVSAVDWVLVD